MEEVKKWFDKANEDLDTALYNLSGKKLDAGIFFLQQSAEKALKALYIKKFKELIKIHDLVILARKLQAPEKIINYCKQLTPAYQYTRYPDSITLNNLRNKSEDFISYTKEILKWVKKSL